MQDLLLEDITPWQIHCPPRPKCADGHTTSVAARAMNVELTCPVCLGLLDKPVAVMECMHRFCEDCISKSIRVGKKECPACRVKCASRRSLRSDPAFAELIATLYPNREDFDAGLVPNALSAALLAHPTRAARLQQQPHGSGSIGQRRRKRDDSSGDSDEPAAESDEDDGFDDAIPSVVYKAATPRVSKPRAPRVQKPRSAPAAAPAPPAKKRVVIGARQEIDLLLLLYPQESRLTGLDKPFLRTSSAVTVFHLCKYLAQKLNRPSNQFVLSVEEMILEEDCTLEEVLALYWGDSDEQLVIQYRLTDDA
eukprot:TRINITY_DN7935_c0_g1_i1.p1 TRINITY_DN7935_c0_g1~~TRINITY_DN7935_c0_g1_i1.p1  ORF type:complete len:309 (-),score=53.15 TRINITY_DN7935_c0_g1_i1:36-962(-)